MTRPQSSQGPSAAVSYATQALDLTIAAATAYQRDDLAARLGGARGLLAGGPVTVYVVGEYKQGKSSLVNALLTTDVCPVDDDISTAVPTMLSYAPSSGATAVYEPVGDDDGTPWTEDIPLEDLGSYVSEGGNPANSRRLRSVHVGVDRRLLAGGLVVVDTPGVGGLGSVQNALTASALPTAHAVVFVSDASQELTEAEVAFARTAAELCPTIVFALTKIDLYPHWRRILEIDLGHLRRAGVHLDAIALSSEFRLAAARTADQALNEESGFPPLTERLLAVVSDAEHVALRAAGAHMLSALNQLRATMTATAAALTGPERSAQLLVELNDARTRAENLRQGARWQQVLTDGFTDIASDVDFDLRARSRAVLLEAEERLGEQDPKKSWPEIEKWLRSRLSAVTLENYAEFARAVRELTDRVAEHFELAESEIARVADAMAPTELVESLTLATAPKGGKSRLSMGVAAFQQSASGVMLFTMLPKLAALVIPSPLSVAAGLAMGGAGLLDQRRQLVEQRRTAAKQTVARFVDEFNQQVGKDLRDAVRTAQREMRETWTARAEEAKRSAQEALAAAQAAADSGTQQAARLARVRTDLESLATVRSRVDQLIARTTRPGERAPSVALGRTG